MGDPDGSIGRESSWRHFGAWTAILLGAALLLFGLYYLLALHWELPGRELFVGWYTRPARRRSSGPGDLVLLFSVGVVLIWRGIAFSNGDAFWSRSSDGWPRIRFWS